MPTFDDIITQATRRLGMDRELQLDIAQELRHHLEDAAEEFRGGGHDDEEANAHAIAALGDPRKLSDDLWAANRGRVRLRLWVKWALRVTLLPACLIAVLYLMSGGIVTYARMQSFQPMVRTGTTTGSVMQWLVDRADRRLKAQMTPTQELIFFGDQWAETQAEAQRALRDAFPDEPLYQLNYIRALMVDLGYELNEGDAAAIKRVHTELQRGRELNPTNGIYDLLEASLLLGKAADLTQDESLSVMVLNRKGEREAAHPSRFDGPVDEATLHAGMAALERAARQPFISMHAIDMQRHRVEQLPPAKSLRDYVFRVRQGVATLLPALGRYRLAARMLCAQAIRVAEQGDKAGALELLDALHRIAAKLAAGQQTSVGLLVAQSMRALEFHTRVFVMDIVGDERGAAAARAAMDQQARHHHAVFGRGPSPESREMRMRAGVILGPLIPAIPGYDVDVSGFRKAEYIAADRGALTALLVVLIAVSIGCSTVGIWLTWRRRGEEDQPMLLWMGWRRLLIVLGLAALLPLGLAVVFAASPLGGRSYGINYAPQNVVMYAVTIVVIATALWLAAAEMLRRRAAEIGITAPPTRRWTAIAIDLSLLMAVCAAVTTVLWLGMTRENMVAGSLGGVLLTWGLIALAPVAVVVFVVRQLAWLRGQRNLGRLLGGMVMRGLVTAAATTGAVTLVLLVSPMQNAVPLPCSALAALAAGALLGLIVALNWLAREPSETALFAVSVVRSVGPVFAVAAVVLAVAVGPVLQWRERRVVVSIAAQSPIWIDLEVTHSDMRLVREALAGGNPAPPRLP